MIRLVDPSRALHEAWVEAMREFEGETLHGFVPATAWWIVDDAEPTRVHR